MAVIKEMELTVSSNKSWEDALQAMQEASKSLKSISSMYIQNHHAVADDHKIVEYLITAKLNFETELLNVAK